MPSVSKILKIELLALFLLATLSLIAFYFQDSTPDNILSITSDSNGVNFLSYYASSLVSVIGFFVGPWIVISFIIFLSLYALVYSKRNSTIDALNFVNILLMVLFATAYFAPSFLGEGSRFLILKNFSKPFILVIVMASFTSFLVSSFRGTISENLGIFKSMFNKCYYGVVSVFSRLTGFLKFINLSRLIERKKTEIVRNVPTMLQGHNNNVIDELEVDSEESVSFTPKLDDSIVSTNEVSGDEKKKKSRRLVTTGKQQELRDKQNRNFEEQYHSLVNLKKSYKSSSVEHGPDEEYFNNIIERIEGKLAEFNIEGSIVNILKGPVVDTFELELGSGVKVSKVLSSEKELSMALLGAPIRIVYPMIGRHTVGIEVPRNPREFILLDEVLSSKDFQNNQFKIPIAMGKDAFGKTFIVDLATMPHMLVAGATGAGKSVFINTLLVSILVKKSPAQLKLILIDPKQLELALYAKLPHLVMPVITDAKRSSMALLWACEEMERRYSILKEFGVRNIDGFNNKLKKATPEMLASIHQYYTDDSEKYELPYLVIIVDEFADLILTKAGKEIENNICRLAAKARAAGIHLVLATQRPSVDVITGLIKSNFPTRVAFRVTSPVDSRTILTTVGAEKLLGKGDMLYRNGTDNKRVHASFVDEDEIEVLANKLAEIPQSYNESAVEFLENGAENISDDPFRVGSHLTTTKEVGGTDDQQLYDRAIQTVLEHRTASASMLQRRLRIGYNRAANLIEQMEARGVVGPAEGSKRRKVLISPDQA
jgi:S-DNA-T family DNA segregation ATPase FtsK/SpoIIIE